MPKPMRGAKPKVKDPGKLFARLMKYILKNYKVHLMIVVVGIFVSVLANVRGTMFMKTLIDGYIVPLLGSENPNFVPLLTAIGQVAVIYLVGVISTYLVSAEQTENT